MKLVTTILMALALAVAGSALAAQKSATLTIKHAMHGCHNWSFAGGSAHASQAMSLKRGGVLTVVDNDVMPHVLIQVSGPKVHVTGAAMKHMGARAHVSFTAKGKYVFKTKAGEDYTKGIKTVGEDNLLKLVVTVA